MKAAIGRVAAAVRLGVPVFLLLALPAVARAAVSCSADVRGDFRKDEVHDEYVDKVFALTVSTGETCAKVYYTMKTTEQLFNGESITSTRRGWEKANTGQSSATRVTYRIARDSKLVSWEFKYDKCVVCGTE